MNVFRNTDDGRSSAEGLVVSMDAVDVLFMVEALTAASVIYRERESRIRAEGGEINDQSRANSFGNTAHVFELFLAKIAGASHIDIPEVVTSRIYAATSTQVPN